MGVASMVLGIVAVCLGVLPFVGVLMLVPAALGLILGIVDTVSKSRAKRPAGPGIAGIALNAVALAITLFWAGLFVWGVSQDGENREECSFLSGIRQRLLDGTATAEERNNASPDYRFAPEVPGSEFRPELKAAPEKGAVIEVPFGSKENGK